MKPINVGREIKKLVRTPLPKNTKLNLTSQIKWIEIRIIAIRILSSPAIKRGKGAKRNQGGRVNQVIDVNQPGYPPTPKEKYKHQGF